jgi:carbon storage regulator CsrA
LHEKIILPTINATVEVVAVKGGVVRLGISAPPEVPVHRAEVQQRRAEWAAPDESNRPRRPRRALRELDEGAVCV